MHTAGHFKDFDSSRIAQAYIWGCRLNHVSPMIVKMYMSGKEAEIASDFYLRQALAMATIFHIRLTTQYIDEIRLTTKVNKHENIATAVSLILSEMDTLKEQ